LSESMDVWHDLREESHRDIKAMAAHCDICKTTAATVATKGTTPPSWQEAFYSCS